MLDAVAFSRQVHKTAPELGKRLQQAGGIVHAIAAIRTRNDHGDIEPDWSRVRVGIGGRLNEQWYAVPRIESHAHGAVRVGLRPEGRSEERRVGKECRSRWEAD